MSRKEFKGAASPLTLNVTIDADDTTIVTTGDATNWPTGASFPFVVRIGNEKILCSSRTGNTLTVAVSGRGVDGTTATTHTTPADVEHVLDAATIDEANAHVNDDSRDDHSQYLNVARHDSTARHLLGTSIPAGSPSPSAPGDAGSDGVSTSAARADHKHPRSDNWGGAPAASAPGDTQYGGASSLLARMDHRHAREAWGVTGDISTSSPGDTAFAGSSGRVADANHRHAREPGVVYALGLYEDRHDDDTGSILSGASTTIATKSVTIPAARIIQVTVYVTIRATADNAFAGAVSVNMDGSPLFAATRRFSTHGATGDAASLVVNVSFTATTRQAAGTYTFDAVVTNDVGAPYIIASNRCLNIFTIGG